MKVLYRIHRLFLRSLEQKPNDKTLALVFVNSSVPTEKKCRNHLIATPTSAIASAFYDFGWPDSKSVMSKTA